MWIKLLSNNIFTICVWLTPPVFMIVCNTMGMAQLKIITGFAVHCALIVVGFWTKWFKRGIKDSTFNCVTPYYEIPSTSVTDKSLLTPWSRVLLEKLTGSAASQEIPRIFGTRKFLTLPTSAHRLSLSWGNSIQSPQHRKMHTDKCIQTTKTYPRRQ